MKKEVIEIDVKVDDAVKGIDKINDGVKEVDESTGDLTNSLDKMSGGLITGFKNAVGGVKKGILAMKSLKVAIAATGVGLLVLAFGALVTFFTKSQKGMDALSVAMAQFGAAVDVIVDRIIAVGEILSNIFNKPLKETLSGIGDEFEGIGDELERDIKLAGELEKATQRLRDLERGQSLTIAIQRKEIEKLRIASKDLSKTNEERVEALEGALALEDFILQTQLKNQRERVRIAKDEFNRANSTAEDEQKFIDEKIRLVDLETESLRKQRTVITELESLKAQGRKDEVAETRERVEVVKTENAEYLEITKTKEEGETDIILDEIKKREDAKKAAALTEKILDQQVRDAKFAIAFQTLGVIGTLAKRGSKLAKGVAVAQTLMNTYQGVTAALAAPSTIPEPFGTILKFANAAAVGVTGALNVKKILAVDPVRGGGSGSGGSVQRPSAPQAQAPDFNIVGSSGTNQLAGAIGSQTQQPVKAYVVGSDMTTQQQLDRNIIDSASVG